MVPGALFMSAACGQVGGGFDANFFSGLDLHHPGIMDGDLNVAEAHSGDRLANLLEHFGWHGQCARQIGHYATISSTCRGGGGWLIESFLATRWQARQRPYSLWVCERR